MRPLPTRRQVLLAGAVGLPAMLTACSADSDNAGVDVTVDAADVRQPVGKNFSQKLTAQGGRAPYRWQIVTGRAPGVKLAPDGTLSGRVERPGTYDLSVAATDADGNASPAVALTVAGLREGEFAPDVVAIGTSLTARLTGEGRVLVTPWAEQWAQQTGYVGLNLARSGRNSVSLASYVGAAPWRTTEAVTIPASGSVLVPVAWEVDRAKTPGTFGEVEGTIERKPFESATFGLVAQFTRSSPGRPVELPAGAPLQRKRTDMAWSNRVSFIEACRNDFLRDKDYVALPPVYRKELNNVDKTLARYRAIARVLTEDKRNPHLIVVGQPNAEGDDATRRSLNAEVNAAIQSEFAKAYADPWSWLRTDEAAQTVGVKLTGEDRKQIALKNTPKSLRFDGLHPSTLGHTALAHYYWDLIKERGWR